MRVFVAGVFVGYVASSIVGYVSWSITVRRIRREGRRFAAEFGEAMAASSATLTGKRGS